MVRAWMSESKLRKIDVGCCDLCANFDECNNGKGRCTDGDRFNGLIGPDDIPVNVMCPGGSCGQVCLPGRHMGDSRYDLTPTFKMRLTKEQQVLLAL